MPARTVVPQLRIRVTPIPVLFIFFFTCFCFGSRYLNIFLFSVFLSTIYVSTIFSILFSLQAALTRARLRIDVKKLVRKTDGNSNCAVLFPVASENFSCFRKCSSKSIIEEYYIKQLIKTFCLVTFSRLTVCNDVVLRKFS